MDSERWRRIDDAFDAARRLRSEERAAYLERLDASTPEIAPTVRELLRADEHAGVFLRSGVLGEHFALQGENPEEIAAFTMFPDRRVGRYQLQRLLATEGPWLAFEAEADDEARRVMVRVRRHTECSETRCREVFERAGFGPPANAPSVTGPEVVGVDGEQSFFIVTPLVVGVPIDVYARERGLDPLGRAVLLAAVCDALAEAHAHGSAHGGLSLDCVLVDDRGAVHVTDFGLWPLIDRCLGARVEDDDEVAAPMRAPELPPGECTARGDVFNLGVMLLELLTCCPLREHLGETAGGEGSRSRTRTALYLAPPSEWLRDKVVPAGRCSAVKWRWMLRRRFDDLVLCATAPNPNDRPASASAFGEALRSAAAPRRLETWRFRAEHVRRTLFRWPPSPLVIATAMVAALLLWFLWVRWAGS